jgi:hypothetical protein
MDFLRKEVLAHHHTLDELLAQHSNAAHEQLFAKKLITDSTTLPTDNALWPQFFKRVSHGTKYHAHDGPTQQLLDLLHSTTPQNAEGAHLDLVDLQQSTYELYHNVFHAFITAQEHDDATDERKQMAQGAFDELFYHPSLSSVTRPSLATLTAQLILLHKSTLTDGQKRKAHEKLVAKHMGHLLRQLQSHADNPHQIPVATLVDLQESVLALTKVFPKRKWLKNFLKIGVPIIAVFIAWYFRNFLRNSFGTLKKTWKTWRMIRKDATENRITDPAALPEDLDLGDREILAVLGNPGVRLGLVGEDIGGMVGRAASQAKLKATETALQKPKQDPLTERAKLHLSSLSDELEAQLATLRSTRDAQLAAFTATNDATPATPAELAHTERAIAQVQERLDKIAPYGAVTQRAHTTPLPSHSSALNKQMWDLVAAYNTAAGAAASDPLNKGKQQQLFKATEDLALFTTLMKITHFEAPQLDAPPNTSGVLTLIATALSEEGREQARRNAALRTQVNKLDREADAAERVGNTAIREAAIALKEALQKQEVLLQKQTALQAMIAANGDNEALLVLQEDLAAALAITNNVVAQRTVTYQEALHAQRVADLTQFGQQLATAQEENRTAQEEAHVALQNAIANTETPAAEVTQRSTHLQELKTHSDVLARLTAAHAAKQRTVASEDITGDDVTIYTGWFGSWHGLSSIPPLPTYVPPRAPGTLGMIAEAVHSLGPTARREAQREQAKAALVTRAGEQALQYDQEADSAITTVESLEAKEKVLLTQLAGKTTAAQEAQTRAKLANIVSRKKAISQHADRLLTARDTAQRLRDTYAALHASEDRLARTLSAQQLNPDDATLAAQVQRYKDEVIRHQEAIDQNSDELAAAQKAVQKANAALRAFGTSIATRTAEATVGRIGRWWQQAAGGIHEWKHSADARKELGQANSALAQASAAVAKYPAATTPPPARKTGSTPRRRKGRQRKKGPDMEHAYREALLGAKKWQAAIAAAAGIEETKLDTAAKREEFRAAVDLAHTWRTYYEAMHGHATGATTGSFPSRPKIKTVEPAAAPAAEPSPSAAPVTPPHTGGREPVFGPDGKLLVPGVAPGR